MSSISFVDSNLWTLPRSQRIPEDTWEKYRVDIIRMYNSGGSRGSVAKALAWIKEQKIPDFNPSEKQLRHRIKSVWNGKDGRWVPESSVPDWSESGPWKEFENGLGPWERIGETNASHPSGFILSVSPPDSPFPTTVQPINGSSTVGPPPPPKDTVGTKRRVGYLENVVQGRLKRQRESIQVETVEILGWKPTDPGDWLSVSELTDQLPIPSEIEADLSSPRTAGSALPSRYYSLEFLLGPPVADHVFPQPQTDTMIESSSKPETAREFLLDSSLRQTSPTVDSRSKFETAREPRNTMSDVQRPQSAMTTASANPTLARTWSTSSTLSSMRRQSRLTRSSLFSRWSHRTATVDDLVDRSSLLTISDGSHSRPVSNVDPPTTDQNTESTNNGPEDLDTVGARYTYPTSTQEGSNTTTPIATIPESWVARANDSREKEEVERGNFMEDAIALLPKQVRQEFLPLRAPLNRGRDIL
ncbi:hypothetical protein BCR34DRAFT_571493 [Clohesyomyces aquaticus]|uniref:Uncharacterized protein n=1 Tax=Clohesyomyces aquaticus TaxID=1231657 RepID=A0A1Y1Z799_9PLEO|nr:hypothetical protein BCR34DRAFT_571493 [Clohesyomyces aquaticus]